MTPEEQAALDRQKALLRRLSRTPEIKVPKHEPAPGQGTLRFGWDLVTSRPMSAEDKRRASNLAAEEAASKGGKPKGRANGTKRKGAKGDGDEDTKGREAGR